MSSLESNVLKVKSEGYGFLLPENELFRNMPKAEEDISMLKAK
tara:strand:- start:1012 stop:1140 length:129 start_codon:yes stop_codon:yes gene_type:complete